MFRKSAERTDEIDGEYHTRLPMYVFPEIDIERAPLRSMNSINEFQVKAAFNTLSDPSPSRRSSRQSSPSRSSLLSLQRHDRSFLHIPRYCRFNPSGVCNRVRHRTDHRLSIRAHRDSNVKGTFHSCTRGNTTCSPVEITGRLPSVIYSELTLSRGSLLLFLPPLTDRAQLSEI